LAGTATLSDRSQIICQEAIRDFEALVLGVGESCVLAGTAKPLMPHLEKKPINTVTPSHHHTTS